MERLAGFITDPRKIIEFPITVAEMCVEFGGVAMAFAAKIMRLVVGA